MYILIKSIPNFPSQEEIHNVFYGDDIKYVREQCINYFNSVIDSEKLAPVQKDVRELEFHIKESENGHEFTLCKQYKLKIHGYLYNTRSPLITDVLQTIKIYHFEHISISGSIPSPKPNLQEDITKEINFRVLKNLDKDSVYGILSKLSSLIDTKETWNRREFTNMLSEITKTYKKELYSSIAKKMRKYHRQKKSKAYSYNFSDLDNIDI